MTNLEVIGAGYGRTGTLSLKGAFEILGFKSYHMKEALDHGSRRDYEMWSALCRGETLDVSAINHVLGGYTATTDFPACHHYQLLMRLNPNAKVVLTVRDPEKWYESCQRTIFTAEEVIFNTWLLQYTPYWKYVSKGLDGCWSGAMFGGYKNFKNREHCIKVFKAHIEEVKRVVPADRLLIFEIKEGWEPLCKFLGKPVPSVPFPHVNDLQDFKRTFMAFEWIDKIITATLAIGGIALAYYAKQYFS